MMDSSAVIMWLGSAAVEIQKKNTKGNAEKDRRPEYGVRSTECGARIAKFSTGSADESQQSQSQSHRAERSRGNCCCMWKNYVGTVFYQQRGE